MRTATRTPDEQREFNGRTILDLCELGNRILASYGIGPERAKTFNRAASTQTNVRHQKARVEPRSGQSLALGDGGHSAAQNLGEPAKVLHFPDPQRVRRAFEQVRQMSEEEIAERTKRDLANFDAAMIRDANTFVVE